MVQGCFWHACKECEGGGRHDEGRGRNKKQNEIRFTPVKVQNHGVQVLTHVKEKLQFAQKEKEAMQIELDTVEAALATHRDDLARIKLTRDKAIVATRKLKDAGSHVTNAALLADLEVARLLLYSSSVSVPSMHCHAPMAS